MSNNQSRRVGDPVPSRLARLRVDRRWLTVVALFGTAGLVLPHATHPLGTATGFLPAFFALVVCADLATAALLLSQFRSNGDKRTLALVAPYLFSGAIVVPHSMVFAGVWSTTGLVHTWPDAAPWLWTFWHTGFALLLGLACLPWGNRRELQPVPRGRRLGSALAVAAGVTAAVWTCTELALKPHRLPTVISTSGDYGLLTRTVGVYVVGAGIFAVVSVGARSIRSRGPARWIVVAAVATLVDVVLTLQAGARWTEGWYVARGASLLAAFIVLGAMIAELGRLYRSLAASHEQLQSRADHDGLTGLLNRRAAYEQVATLVQLGRPLVLVMLDIDHFKAVNDEHGHPAGDAVLVEIAHRLQSHVRAGDIVCRWGGEEFVVALPGTEDGGRRVVERLLEAVRATPVELPEGARRNRAAVTLSAGMSLVDLGGGPGLGPAPGDDTHVVDEALRRADLALYRAKSAGRDRLVESC